MENPFSRSVFAADAGAGAWQRAAARAGRSPLEPSAKKALSFDASWHGTLQAVLRGRSSPHVDGLDWAAVLAPDSMPEDRPEPDAGGDDQAQAAPAPKDRHSWQYLHRYLKDQPPQHALTQDDRARLDAALRPAFPERAPLRWPDCRAELVPEGRDHLELYALYLDYEVERRPPQGEPAGPVVRLFGKTAQGQTVLLRAHSKRPYWYFRPRGELLRELDRDEPRVLLWVRERLNAIAREKRPPREGQKPEDAVLGVRVERDLRSDYCYEPDPSAFVRVEMREPGLVPCLRDAVASKQFAWAGEDPAALPYERFEADIPYVMRFMIDADVSGCGWVRVPVSALRQTGGQARSRCQLELSVDAAAVSGAPDIDAVPPLRFLEYDIVRIASLYCYMCVSWR